MENSNTEKTNLPILKTKDLPDSFIFHECVIGKKLIESDYGFSYILFHKNNGTDVITFVNEDSSFGINLKEYFNRIVNSVFEMEIKSFGEGKYKGFAIKRITKLRDLVVPSQTKLEGF